MDKQKRGSAYIMVVFVSFPIFLVVLLAFAVSINSRNISARHTNVFGMYELASAANVYAILMFEQAYLTYRNAAHSRALLQFVEINGEDNVNGVTLPAEYLNRFKFYMLPMIWTNFEPHFTVSGNERTRQFEINLGTEHVFYGTMRITQESNQIHFWTTVTKRSDNVIPLSETVRGIVGWPDAAERRIYFCEQSQIKNLDYFTPWVVEFMRK